MTLDARIAAYETLKRDMGVSRELLEQASTELCLAIAAEGRRLLPDMVFAAHTEGNPRAMAIALADLLDRQLAGNAPARVLEFRAQAVLMRAIAGALDGMRAAGVAKKTGKGGGGR